MIEPGGRRCMIPELRRREFEAKGYVCAEREDTPAEVQAEPAEAPASENEVESAAFDAKAFTRPDVKRPARSRTRRK